MPREINAEGYALIKEFEQGPNGGAALMPYKCPAGVWTNGWGNTVGVHPGNAITIGVAQADLDRNLDRFEACVEASAKQFNDNEFAAMVSLAFNIGEAGFKGSSVLRLHNAGDKNGAARSFGLWNKATVGGKLTELPGLTRRRAAESALYLKPVDEVVIVPTPQKVQPEVTTAASKTVVAGGITVAAGLGSVADQLDQIRPIIDSFAATGASLQNVMKLGAVGLSVVALVAGAFMLWRYIVKRRRGEVLST